MPPQTILSRLWLRAVIITLAFIFLTLLFVSPPIRYAADASKRSFTPFNEATSKDSPTRELITLEHAKAVDEIKFRLTQQDSWYHYKFIFIGALLALFLGQTGLFKGREEDNSHISYTRLKYLLTADSNHSVIALACVLALIVDMHIRNHMFSMQTLGLWIANYVEPAYLPLHPPGGFYPWEQFIRRPDGPSTNLDSLYRLAFSTHLHYMTKIIYLLYITVLQQVCLAYSRSGGRGRRQIVLFGFMFVHLSALAFVFVAHAVPSTYEMSLIPLGRWANGWESMAYYLIPWLALVALNVPYLLLLRVERVNQVKSRAVRTATGPTAA